MVCNAVFNSIFNNIAATGPPIHAFLDFFFFFLIQYSAKYFFKPLPAFPHNCSGRLETRDSGMTIINPLKEYWYVLYATDCSMASMRHSNKISQPTQICRCDTYPWNVCAGLRALYNVVFRVSI